MSELLLPMLEREGEHADAVADAIKKALGGKATAILLGGDAAKGRLEPGHPLELVIVENASGRRNLNEALRELAALLKETWALELDVRVIALREATRAVALDDLWELLPVEGPPSFLFNKEN